MERDGGAALADGRSRLSFLRASLVGLATASLRSLWDARKWSVYGHPELRNIKKVLRSRQWGGTPEPSEFVTRLAQAFASHQAARYAVCVTSGTKALTVALRAIGIKAGDEVLVPALTFAATANAVLEVGAAPVFVDVDPDTWCIDVEQIEKLLSDRSRAVIPVHLGSRMANMTRIMQLASLHRLRVIEDCAHMPGGVWKGQPAGSIGDAGCFSFQTTKVITAGEGGIITTNSRTLADRCRAYAHYERLSDVLAHTILVSNCRMSELQAAVLLAQLQRLPGQVERRSANMSHFTDRLVTVEGLESLRPDGGSDRNSGYGYYFKYHCERCGSVPRDTLVEDLRAAGIPASGKVFEPVYKSSLFGWKDVPTDLDYSSTSCPVAEKAAYEQSVWLPHQWFLGRRRDIDRTIDTLQRLTVGYRQRAALAHLADAPARFRT